ncbi:MAG: fumarylacetoacetate hydrolase family protein [Bacteroidetes bacterium]|jgi:2-keto-4-pentenoate hydratase/2-oxohepta-3-ene-1,7-dioic acid hydratase in catechol pathway|nr:fumarylacetoacetate hydrolase family protein [Bacteroidota bacterium]
MKIICVGRNYVKHIEELKNEVPTEPVIFLKPDSSILLDGKPFFYPEHSQNIHYEAEIVVKIAKNGKHIEERFAHTYYQEVALGIDLTARDTQDKLKLKGLPWELSKAFDGSAVVGSFIPLEELPPLTQLPFDLHKNGVPVQQGNTSQMIYPIDRIISFVSQYFMLRQGDMLFTGTPSGVGPIAVGDLFQGHIDGRPSLRCAIK